MSEKKFNLDTEELKKQGRILGSAVWTSTKILSKKAGQATIKATIATGKGIAKGTKAVEKQVYHKLDERFNPIYGSERDKSKVPDKPDTETDQLVENKEDIEDESVQDNLSKPEFNKGQMNSEPVGKSDEDVNIDGFDDEDYKI